MTWLRQKRRVKNRKQFVFFRVTTLRKAALILSTPFYDPRSKQMNALIFNMLMLVPVFCCPHWISHLSDVTVKTTKVFFILGTWQGLKRKCISVSRSGGIVSAVIHLLTNVMRAMTPCWPFDWVWTCKGSAEVCRPSAPAAAAADQWCWRADWTEPLPLPTKEGSLLLKVKDLI